MNDTRPENFETIYEFLEEEEASVMTEGFQRPPPAAQHNNKHNSRSSSRLNKVLSQVQIKDRIYESAAQVAVWLGPSSDNSTLAMDTLREIGADPNWQDPGTRIRTLATSLPRNAISSIVDLFERNYWKRLWIVQEIFYARSAVLYCGKDCIEWKEIRQAMALFKTAEWSRVMNELYPPGSSLARGSRSHYSFAQVLAT
ncbi:hypothetical protein CGMCC3_g16381 [Colletotrichum fructicola]|nr:uncharacterized protein CGMCC3_g16381 [Colletotrichum fructicola]KAE9567539.1 hypothetical protein CGMCC3_g16381 [Colletotrichum fructicola]